MHRYAKLIVLCLALNPLGAPAADTKGLVSRVMREHEGGSVLVIGHSNTVPELIHELGDIDVPPIGDDEYDTLYVLSIPSFGQASLLRMEY